MLKTSSKHILPNGGLRVIYHVIEVKNHLKQTQGLNTKKPKLWVFPPLPAIATKVKVNKDLLSKNIRNLVGSRLHPGKLREHPKSFKSQDSRPTHRK